MTSTDLDANPANAFPATPAVVVDDWHAPPPRAVRLHAGTMALLFAAIAVAAVAIPMVAADRWGLGMKIGAAGLWLVLAGAAGAWIGARLRHQRWKLDQEGLWLRSGRLWWRETRVPASRVQHVDLKHGPLERRFRLATLVVHTAAVHLSGITVRGLDEADAQRLRDALARQLDDAGDAL